MKRLILILSMLTAVISTAAELKNPEELIIDTNAKIQYDSIRINPVFFDSNWKMYNAKSIEKEESRNTVKTLCGSFYIDLSTVKEADEKLKVSYKATSQDASGIETQSLCLAIYFPFSEYAGRTIKIDNKDIKFPELFKELEILKPIKASLISIGTRQGLLEITGDLDIRIQDDRKFGGEYYQLRIAFKPGIGKIKEAALDIGLKCTKYTSRTVNIRDAVNMGFRDEVEGDGKGGWTDQGANDLRMIKPGVQKFCGVDFDIIDEKKNSGKACLAMQGPSRDYFLKEADIKLPDASYKYLYILHSIAWAPQNEVSTGTLTVKYADGSESVFESINKKQVANWWNPTPIADALLGWTGENPHSYVGLFIAKYRLENKNLKSLKIVSSGKAVWMIAGISLGDNPQEGMSDSAPNYIIEDKNWKPLKQGWRVEKGSALDLSFISSDMPAGKYGPVVNRNGRFEFRNKPGVQAKFLGANTSYTANYLEHAEAEKFIEDYKKSGYNAIRFHHIDKDLPDPKSDKSTVFDTEMLDKIDYLFSVCKKNGVYVTVDLYTDRRIKEGEIPELKRPLRHEFKYLVPVLDSAFENWKEYTKNLLTHKNPYTGMSWGEDPALISICVLNEDNMSDGGNWTNDPDILKLYQNKFEEWLQTTKADGDRHKLFSRFVKEKQTEGYLKMTAYLKSLGIDKFTNNVNMNSGFWEYAIRDRMNMVDNHQYWDHPSWIGKAHQYPYGHSQRSAVKYMAQVPTQICTSRFFGKPFTITEINYCYPNRYRAEGGVIAGAIASLQEWDGLWLYSFAHNRQLILGSDAPISSFDIINDPINMLGSRIVALLYLRGDISPAKGKIPFFYSEKSGKSMPLQELALCTGIGLVNGDNAESTDILSGKKDSPWKYALMDIPADTEAGKMKVYSSSTQNIFENMKKDGALGEGEVLKEKKFTKSDTGEITCDGTNGIFKAVSARSEAFVIDANTEAEGNIFSVKNTDPMPMVFFASALDGKDLKDSSRILILHLTDAQNNLVKFLGSKQTVLGDLGKAPRLARSGKCSFSMKETTHGNFELYALGIAGERLEKVNFSASGTELEVLRQTGPCMAYELTKK